VRRASRTTWLPSCACERAKFSLPVAVATASLIFFWIAAGVPRGAYSANQMLSSVSARPN
jgi:hypothetical protein